MFKYSHALQKVTALEDFTRDSFFSNVMFVLNVTSYTFDFPDRQAKPTSEWWEGLSWNENLPPKPSWEVALRAWSYTETQQHLYYRHHISEVADYFATQPITHALSMAGVHVGKGLEHMPAAIHIVEASTSAGQSHPRMLLRNVDDQPVDIWTEGHARALLGDLATRTNIVESAKNKLRLKYKPLTDALYRERDGTIPTAAELAELETKAAALKKAFEPAAIEREFQAVMAELSSDALPDDLPLAKSVLIGRIEAAATGQQKALKGAFTQQAIDNWAACVDQDTALAEIAKQCALGTIEIDRTATIEAAKVAFATAKAAVEAVTALNTPHWRVNGTLIAKARPSLQEISGRTVAIRAEQPAGKNIEGNVALTVKVVAGTATVTLNTLTPPAYQYSVAIPDDATEAVELECVARNLCGPSKLKVRLTP